MIGGVATAAAVRTWPFRVYSFPSEIRLLSVDELKRIYVERAMASILGEARKNIWFPPWSVLPVEQSLRGVVSRRTPALYPNLEFEQAVNGASGL
jgi:hypothetical protein